ncbi:MAG: ABC transporter permease [Calditerrivibrio sp.]|nr:ABC transporter permease [Calditerrivibrio sp.]MCA1932542.1 ABC transporter permease [Calditerrivibrio sp.]
MFFKIFLYLKIVHGVFKSFKVRTALAVFGVLLGAFSLVLVNNISRSLKVKVESEISKFGENTITVAAGRLMRHGKGGVLEKAKTMKLRDAEMIRNNVVGVKDVSPYVKRGGVVRYEMNNAATSILGVDVNYFELKKLSTKSGRFLNQDDKMFMDKVCIIGSEVKNKLFGKDDALGKTILIYRAPFKVVGILEEKGSDLNGTNMDDMVYIPITTFMRRAANLDYIDGVEVIISDWNVFESIKADIVKILRNNHRLYGDAKDDFTVINPVDVMQIQNETVSIVTFLGTITAGIAYLIGGLGIFSIMILSVSLRKTEVGIRRAVGARKIDIFRQFLLESGIIGVVGSLIGIVAGIVVSIVAFKIANLPVVISIYGLIFSGLMSFLVGIFSGIYPSYNASKTDPINALRG